MTKEYVCIVCPRGCHLKVSDDSGEVVVTGNSCPRGKKHGIAEFTNPMRMITSTVKIENGMLPRLSVVSSQEVPKSILNECIADIYKVSVKAPVKCGDVIIENIQNTGADIVASRSMKEKESN